MKKTINTSIIVQGKEVPLKIIRESRKNSRAAIGKAHLILRMPSGPFAPSAKKAVEWVQEWFEDLVEKKPGILERLAINNYKSGTQLHILNTTYTVTIAEESPYRQHHITRDGNDLTIFFAQNTSGEEHQRARRLLLSRLIAADHLPFIQQRVKELNDIHFQQAYHKVSLRYTTSKWGSCSSDKKITFSTRLLFAPPKVIDYVIIHELAHLIEQNHSSRFWALVQKAMPDYKQQVALLSEHGHTYNF